MSGCRESRRISPIWRRVVRMAGCCAIMVTSSCQQQMARQPSYRPLEPTEFFADGRASRPLVEGVVPRGRPIEEPSVLTYLKRPSRPDAVGPAAFAAGLALNPLAALTPWTAGPTIVDYVDVSPIALDMQALERGQARFNIYCSVCHDRLGTGHGKIVERGYLQPPSFHTDYSRGFERRCLKVLLRDVPVGYLFEVVTRGYGGMPDYASQIPPEDRWKIVAYVRALQMSQWTPLKDLPAAERVRIQREAQAAKERP
jgi:mono/diheme cytochrome c family protein